MWELWEGKKELVWRQTEAARWMPELTVNGLEQPPPVMFECITHPKKNYRLEKNGIIVAIFPVSGQFQYHITILANGGYSVYPMAVQPEPPK